MEPVDVVLYLTYLAGALALGCVVWSTVRRWYGRKSRLAMQNGIHAHRLNTGVWLAVVALAVIARLAGDGSIADIILITLLFMLTFAVASVAWSMLRRK